MIGILDMEMGNLSSVWNALYESGFDPVVVREAAALDDIDHLIVPGVGNFGMAMEHLEGCGMARALRSYSESGRPFMGLCVGMQILASMGTEGGNSRGLGLIDGIVERLPVGQALRIPHVGWNTVSVVRAHPILAEIKPDRDFYFVHSYAFDAKNEADIVATSDYGQSFACIVGRDNVVGCQFHPEKSQANGLRVLENFCHWDGKC